MNKWLFFLALGILFLATSCGRTYDYSPDWNKLYKDPLERRFAIWCNEFRKSR